MSEARRESEAQKHELRHLSFIIHSCLGISSFGFSGANDSPTPRLTAVSKIICGLLVLLLLVVQGCSPSMSTEKVKKPPDQGEDVPVAAPSVQPDMVSEQDVKNVVDQRDDMTVTASSVQCDADWCRPGNAVDGDRSTRWSSESSDPQWIEIDFGETRELAGLVLHWETAYAKAYEILISTDGQNWSRVYATTEGDGGDDDIYFEKRSARFLKILGKKRGTYFGYSLWEVTFKGADEAVSLTASSTRGTDVPENLLDGAFETEWHSAGSDKEWLQIDFGKEKLFSEISLTWGEDYARAFELATSDDGDEWNTVYFDEEGKGGATSIYVEPTTSRYVRIVCSESATGNGFAIRRVEFGMSEEGLSLQKFYEIAAERAPGCYPRWLSREQAFWTIVGVPDDDKESIICEDGTIEHHKRGFTLMPLLYVDGKLISRDEAVVTQSLENNHLPIPSVHWAYGGLDMHIKMFAYGKPAESATYTRYTIHNRRKKNVSGSLFLLLRPFQLYPPWQGQGEGESEEEGKGLGGLTHIRSIHRTEDGLDISGKYHICLLTKPDGYGTASGKPAIRCPYRDTLVDGIRKGIIPPGGDVVDPDNFASAVLQYDFELEPGDSKDVFLAMPLHKSKPALTARMDRQKIKAGFEGMFMRLASFWEMKVNPIEIDIPEVGMVDTLKANIAYSFITKDGPSLQPGSWCYDKSWIRDGSIAVVAFLRMGFTNEAREFLDWYAGYQRPTGEIPCVIDNKAENPFWENISEYDSQGEFVYAVLQYYKFTRDREFLEDKLTNVVKALEFAEALRNRRLSPDYRDDPKKRLCYGLIAKSYAKHYYLDNFWTLRGWKDGKTIAQVLGRPDLAEWMGDQYEALRQSVYRSIDRAMETYGIDYIPEYPEGVHFWPASIAMGIVYCDELSNMPQPALQRTFDKTYARLQDWLEPGAEYRFTPEEMPIAEAFLYLDQKERALEFLRFMLGHRKPIGWKQFTEVVNSNERKPTIFGDMPHTWVSAQYINALMSLLLYEKGNALVLGHGIPEEWLSSEGGISIGKVPTHFGTISYEMRKAGNTVEVHISGDADPPDGIILKSPLKCALRSVSVNGESCEEFSNGEVILPPALPAVIVLSYGDTPAKSVVETANEIGTTPSLE